MRPVIWLLSISTNLVVRLLGGDPNKAGEELTEEERQAVAAAARDAVMAAESSQPPRAVGDDR